MEGPRIRREKATVDHMIRIYCKAHHKEPLCESCEEMMAYAHHRLSRCPFGEQKSTCGKCTIHCYKPDMRDQIKEVMRYAGPRMLIHNPLSAVQHLFDSMRKPPELPKRNKV